MQPSEFVELFGRVRGSAILRTSIAGAAAPAMESAVRAGFRIIEFTLTTPGAYELIGSFSRRAGLVVGAGTVLSVDEVRRSVEAGAQFLVSPVVDETVIAAAKRMGVAMMPGCHTPTEMLTAYRAGAPLQKLFPAPGGGAAYLRACRGPLPFLNIVPTNGVDAGNVAEFLAAGAHAVGFVNPLFDPDDMAAGRFDAIEQRGRELLEAIRRAG